MFPWLSKIFRSFKSEEAKPAVKTPERASAEKQLLPQTLPTVIAQLPNDEGMLQRMLVVAPHGLPSERPIFGFEIIGVYDPDSPPPYSGPDGFRQNGVFLHFLHWVIAVDGPSLPSAQQAAQALGTGLLQVLDGRARYSGGDIAEDDILGAYEVRDGKIVERSYKSCLTENT